MRWYLIFGIILSLSSCQKANNDWVEFGMGESEEIFISSLFSSIETIVLETTDQSIIGEISSIKYSDDRIFILDKRRTNSVFIFDSKGEFISKIEGGWTGPGFLNYPDNIAIIDEKLFVYDPRQNKVLSYSFEGEFMDERYLKTNNIYSLDMIAWKDSLVFFDFYSNPESLFELKVENGDILFEKPFGSKEYKVISGRRLPYLSKTYENDIRVQVPGTDCIYQFNGSETKTTCFDLDASSLFEPGTLVNFYDFYSELQMREAYALRGEMVDLRQKTIMSIQKGNSLILSIWDRIRNVCRPVLLINDSETFLPDIETLPTYNVIQGEITLHFFPGDLKFFYSGTAKEKSLDQFFKKSEIDYSDNPIIFRLKE
jgi:hypothetical protein